MSLIQNFIKLKMVENLHNVFGSYDLSHKCDLKQIMF